MSKTRKNAPRRRGLAMVWASARVLFFACGGFLVGIALFDFVIMPQLTGRGAETAVPDLIGRSVAQARAILKDEGLALGSIGETFSSIYPDGYVVSQAPEPLVSTKRGQTVDVHVSFGRAGLVIPDVGSVGYREAQVSLSRTGLRMGRVSHAFSPRVSKDAVIATAPEGGALAAPGTIVDLLVSLGPAPVSFLVPDLKGRHVDDVRAFFDRSGIRLVEVPTEGDFGAPPGQVVGQRPAPGRRIRPADVLEVDVSAAGRGRWR